MRLDPYGQMKGPEQVCTLFICLSAPGENDYMQSQESLVTRCYALEFPDSSLEEASGCSLSHFSPRILVNQPKLPKTLA